MSNKEAHERMILIQHINVIIFKKKILDKNKFCLRDTNAVIFK